MFICCFKFQENPQMKIVDSLKLIQNQLKSNKDKEKFFKNFKSDNSKKESANYLLLNNNLISLNSRNKIIEATSDQLNDEKFLKEFSNSGLVLNIDKNDNLWRNEILNKNEYNFVESITNSVINQFDVKLNDHSETTIINNNDDEFSWSSQFRLKNPNNGNLFNLNKCNDFKNNFADMKTKSSINCKKINDINNKSISEKNSMKIHGEIQLRPGKKKKNFSVDNTDSFNTSKNQNNNFKNEFNFNNKNSGYINFNQYKNIADIYTSNKKKYKKDTYSFKKCMRLNSNITNISKINKKNKKNNIDSQNQYNQKRLTNLPEKKSKTKHNSPNTTRNPLLNLINNSSSFINNSLFCIKKKDEKCKQHNEKYKKNKISRNINNQNYKSYNLFIENIKDKFKSCTKNTIIKDNCMKNSSTNNDKINFKVFTEHSSEVLNNDSILKKIEKKINLKKNINTNPKRKLLKQIKNTRKTINNNIDIISSEEVSKNYRAQRSTYTIGKIDDMNEKYFENIREIESKENYNTPKSEINNENDNLFYVEKEEDNKINKIPNAFYYSNHLLKI